MSLLPARPDPVPPVVARAGAAAFAAFAVAGTVQRAVEGDPTRAWTAGAAALLLGAAAFLGPRRALVPLVVSAAAAVAVLEHGLASGVGWFGLCVLLAWATLTCGLATVLTLWGAALLLFVAELAFTTPDAGWAAWLAGSSASVVGCLLGRRQRHLVFALRAAQEGLAQRATAEERNRIARELHDVIAHSLTVSLLHVSAARLAVADDPDEAGRALAEAERLGRASLAEVRHAVGLLRDAEATDPTAPLPGTTDLPELLAGFRRAGLDVSAELAGDVATLPATTGLAAYRIVQEALTNAVRHGSGRPVRVAVEVDESAVELTVDSGGPAGSGQGLGLLGMRERAAAVGGTCTAGPFPGGWRVAARLPRLPEPASETVPS